MDAMLNQARAAREAKENAQASGSRGFEESTSVRSSSDLDEIVRKAKEAPQEDPEKLPEFAQFDDDEHTAIGQMADLAASMKLPEPVAPLPSANVVRRRTNPAMPVARISEPMAAVRASSPVIARASSPMAIVPEPAPAHTASIDDDLDAAFADPMFEALGPLAESARRDPHPTEEVVPQPHEPEPHEPEPPAAKAPPRPIAWPPKPVAAQPAPEPPPSQTDHAPPWQVDAPRPAFPAPAPRVDAAPRAEAMPVALDSGGGSSILVIVLVVVIALAGVGGVLGYRRLAAAEQEASEARQQRTTADKAAFEAARELAAVKTELDALKAAKAELALQLAEHERIERERAETTPVKKKQ
jgi:hypothetical protein